MGTSHVPFAMPAGRVVHPSAPDGGDALPIVARPPQPPLPATQRVWRSCMARALHPTSKPSPPAHSASAYMPQPPSTPPEPTADSPRSHEHHARLDAQPASHQSHYHCSPLIRITSASPLARPSPLRRKDAGASFRLRLRGRRQCPGCRMGTSHVPFAMPAGRVVHPSAPDGGDALPIVARPPQPPLPATQRVWRSCMARALHPTSKPSPPAHSASAYMPQPPSNPPEPPADSHRFHEHPARLDAQPASHRSHYLSLPSRPPLPPREEGCRRVIPAPSTWPPTMSRMSDGDKPRAVRNARWPRSAPVRSGWGRRASYRRATPAASATGHTARLALLHGEGTPSHIQAIAPGSLRLRLHAATALHSSRANSGLSPFP